MSRLATRADRLAARWIPQGATARHDSPDAAVYYYDEMRGRQVIGAIAYRGSAGRSAFHHTFRTPEQREQYTGEFLAGIARSTQAREARAAERKAWTNPLQPGDILYSSWGYDQTNVDWYVVQRVTGQSAWIVRIAGSIDSSDSSFMSGRSVPVLPADIRGESECKRVRPGFEGRPSISLTSYASATLWDGTPKYCSWYA